MLFSFPERERSRVWRGECGGIFVSNLKTKSMRLISNLIEEIASVVNTLSVSSKEKKRIQADLAAAVNRQLESLQRSRAEVVRTEAEGNWLQRSWRPIVMLAVAGIVLAGVLFDLPLGSEKSRLWDLLEIGIGGYVVGWSLEKVAACWKGGAR